MTDLSLSSLFSGFLSGDDATSLLVAALAIAIMMGLVMAVSAGYFRIILITTAMSHKTLVPVFYAGMQQL